MRFHSSTKLKQIQARLEFLYGKDAIDTHMRRFQSMLGRYGVGAAEGATARQWSEKDCVLITYADMVQAEQQAPLETLGHFSRKYFKGSINSIHLLPFYPWSSDDGFSVIDYREVDEMVGDWKSVDDLSQSFSLMFDLVLNHCSAQSQWFKDFQTGIAPGRHYFIEQNDADVLSKVVRPRTTPLLTESRTRDGKTKVWTTFSADQVDLNWENPDLLFEFIDILFQYIAHGAKLIRLDAVAFLWKRLGTDCLHLPETHEVVKLLRDIVDLVAPDVWIITETNVPHKENISYFGEGDEAQMVYNFSLPPLILHALLSGNGKYLSEWASSLQAPPEGCTYFNFTSSHDGIGVRPLQGLIPDAELHRLVEQIKDRGGHVSSKTDADGKSSPYELNITWFSAMKEGPADEHAMARFLCSQAIALSFRGIPGIYFHNLFATENDASGVKETGRARSINRKKWQLKELELLLGDSENMHAAVFAAYIKMIRKRNSYAAFHPDTSQDILELDSSVFALLRTPRDADERILCLYNLTPKVHTVSMASSSFEEGRQLYDLLASRKVSCSGKGLKLKAYQALWLTQR